MRLTINLDSDLYAVAKSLARESDSSLSAAVNQLLRRALAQPAEPETGSQLMAGKRVGKAGLPSVSCDHSFTSDDVYRMDAETA